MSLKIVIDHAGYTGDTVGYAPIITDGLACWHFPKISADRAIANHPSGTPATVVGNPLFLPSHMEAKGGADYLVTAAEETQNLTILAVAKAREAFGSGSANAPTIGGNFSVAEGGCYLGYYYSSGGTPEMRLAFRRALVGGSTTTSHIANETYDVTQWAFVAASAVGVAQQSLYHKTDGFEQHITPGGEALLSAAPITAGGLELAYLGDTDLAFFAVYNRALSANEVEQVYQQVKAYLAARNGINV